MDVCVYVCFSIILECLEQFQPNSVHIRLYMYKNIIYVIYVQKWMYVFVCGAISTKLGTHMTIYGYIKYYI
jgi:hypothetical protein